MGELEAKLGVALVRKVHNVTAETAVDCLELSDPDGNAFVLNQAHPGFPAKMERIGVKLGLSPTPNLLALVEAVHFVPPGATMGLSKFFHNILGAFVAPKERGWAVHFQPSRALRQMLTFADDDAERDAPTPGVGSVCIYMPSEGKFREAFDKCTEYGLHETDGSWEEAQRTREFRVRKCFDPSTQKVALEFECVIRAPDHEGSRIPARAGAIQ